MAEMSFGSSTREPTLRIAEGVVAILVLAVISIPVAGQDRPDCLISPGEMTAQSAPDGPVMLDLPGGPASIELDCQGRQLERLLVRLPIGSRHDITLYTASGRNRESWKATSTDGAPLDWVELDASRRHANSMILQIRSPRNAAPGDRLSARLSIEPDNGDAERFVVPIDVELTEEAPMFRDQFDVDPVIGQFSLVL